ncbi:uncharacterized protein LOC120146312 [Hibiscus syriacus]|uniref:uncharacterized protein LOC120146312 n=1 Tax=Hibiscus syriacus TaxID=106335 RepID=UPI001920D413|nr:uncharacterized protein LOC120146312 [Hibiscus syriacus]
MQSLMAARTFVTVSRMLSKVEKSCCITMSEMMSTENPVQEQFLQREDKQLVLQFRPAPDSIQTNQSGKTDDVHNSEMINQEELVVEVDSLAFVGVRPEKLILKMQRDQKMDASLGSIDPEYLDKILSNDVPGSSDAKQMKST